MTETLGFQISFYSRKPMFNEHIYSIKVSILRF